VADGGQGSLRQQITRVRRIERSVERSLPDRPAPAPAERRAPGVPTTERGAPPAIDTRPAPRRRSPASTSGTDDTPQAAAKAAARATAEATTQAESAPAGRDVDAPRQDQATGNDAPARERTAPVLTPAQLRALALRDDSGRFLSREEKDRMSPAELAQARLREQRDAAGEDKRDGDPTLLNRTLKLIGDNLTDDGDATDAAGTAVGNAFYSSAKELGQAYQELTGEDSNARKAYEWVRNKRAARAGASGQEGSRGTAEAIADADANQARRADNARDARQDDQEARQAARVEQTDALTDQADDRHDETLEATESQTEAIEDGLDDVVDAIERIPPPGGGGGGFSPLDMLRGRERGGRSPRTRPGRGGRLGRLWEGVRSRLPGLGGAAAEAASGGGAAGWGSKLLAGGSRLAGAAAVPLTALLAFQGTKDSLGDNLSDGQKNVVAGSAAVGSGGGALAGAGAGAVAGAAMGSVVPVLGTGIGGVLGGLIGGALGAWGGEEAGKKVGEAVAGTMDQVKDAAEDTLDDQEKERARQDGGARWYNPLSWFSGQPASTPTRSASTPAGASGGRDETLLESDELGRVSEKYESGGRGVGTVSSGIGDAGGVSYGEHQLASRTGTMQAFLDSKEGEPYRAEFKGMRAGSEAFSSKYREIAQRDPEGFEKAQQDYITRTHYKPVEAIAKDAGMDTSSEAIQEALYSQSVQHSRQGNRIIIENAVEKAGKDASEEEMVNAIYDARTDYASRYASASATTDRYRRERRDVLAIAGEDDTPGETPTVDESAALAAAGQAPTSDTPAREPRVGRRTTATIAAATTDVTTPTAARATASEGSRATARATRLPEPTTEPVDDRQAAKALHPAPKADESSPSSPRRSRPAPSPQPPAVAARDGRDGKDGSTGRNGKDRKSEGLRDVAMEFDDTTLTLMAYDRV